MSETKTIKAKLIRDAYGAYSIGGQVGQTITLTEDLAKRMVDSGHAEIITEKPSKESESEKK